MGLQTDVLVTNADFDESVSFDLIVGNRQNARMPTRVGVVATGSCFPSPCGSSVSAPATGDDLEDGGTDEGGANESDAVDDHNSEDDVDDDFGDDAP